MNDMIAEVKAALAKLENAGIIERTGEMKWSDRCCELQPVYAETDLGRALHASGIGFDDYLSKPS
jgi:hypothetical protein